MKIMKDSKQCPECRMPYLRQKDAIRYIVVTLSTFAIDVIVRSIAGELSFFCEEVSYLSIITT
jgi:hypothetical protein